MMPAMKKGKQNTVNANLTGHFNGWGIRGLTYQVNRRGATAARRSAAPYRHVRLNAGLGPKAYRDTNDLKVDGEEPKRH